MQGGNQLICGPQLVVQPQASVPLQHKCHLQAVILTWLASYEYCPLGFKRQNEATSQFINIGIHLHTFLPDYG
jgi:hypothetical protein